MHSVYFLRHLLFCSKMYIVLEKNLYKSYYSAATGYGIYYSAARCILFWRKIYIKVITLLPHGTNCWLREIGHPEPIFQCRVSFFKLVMTLLQGIYFKKLLLLCYKVHILKFILQLQCTYF
jgi:hypothetical protein